MEFKDRVANKPNRVKLTYEDSGASAYATVELADEPIESGTPLNKTTFDKLQKELNAYVVGNVLVTSTNENPSKYLGGTWELIDKGFKNTWGNITYDSYIGDENYYGATGYGSEYTIHALNKMRINFQRSGNTVRLRIDCFLKPGSLWDDHGKPSLAHIDFEDFGFKQLHYGFFYMTLYNDQTQSVGFLMSLLNNGTLSQADIIGAARQITIPQNFVDPISFDFTAPLDFNDMLDDFCDKFYWKRIK